MHSSIKDLLIVALVTLSPLTNAQLVIANSNTLTTGWSYLNCYSDSTSSRSLQGSAYRDGSNMTDENCVSYCDNGGFKYAGIEYSAECYCGNTFQGSAAVVTDGRCNMACSGNSTEVCGGPNGLTVFSRPGGPIVNPGLDNYGSLGCYNDSGAARTLRYGMAVVGGASNMSAYNCITACSAANYPYAGVEYSQECYCDSTISNYGAPASDGSAGCNMLCSGNSKEYCGGPNRIDVYELGAPIASSSVSGSATSTTTTTAASTTVSTTLVTTTTTKASTTTTTTPATTTTTTTTTSKKTSISQSTSTSTTKSSAASSSTTSKSSSTSTPKTSTISSTSPTTSKTSTVSSLSPTTSKTSAISSSSSSLSTTKSTSLTKSVASTSTTTSSSASTSSSGTATSGWTYQGCWTDEKYGRILPTQFPDSSSLTQESCIALCDGAGYVVAGMEYSSQCFCGNMIIEGGALSPHDSDCAMTCSGNNAEICGGPNLMTIFGNGPVTAIAPPVPQNSSLPGKWQYAGCLTDVADGGVRTFPWQLILTNNNSAQNCLTQCSNFGYGRAGMEYGDECYCGDLSDIQSAGATIAPDTDCNMPCSGNASYFCGGPNRMSSYAWVGTGLPQWTYASGNAAGAYEFLIGGVTIPLVTAANVNGKVTYVEKHGTGVNGTGAYELDIAQLNNFTGAWRTMVGLKTDVFCSAGLILPDRAGRQINIGGWSVDSLFGVRLYWPDGSPGVNGVNDWQENVNEVALQTGRWYPSALILANGSILVVGGENGSNGAPVPTLEILPKPAGGTTLFMDWLNRTDPLNLYPFLSVLPSGNVFVAYYNEARILDPGSFATLKSLPNIPGQVSNNVSGRTYPLEGTAVLMPQYAPYSDPLSVMLCGGANQGMSVGIDNCVTIQPEVANPTWSIERMPSKRVMSCMATLPDGTYLIINGAHIGTAGFGLAEDPNLNAVLYDPTKPVNQRMTVMSNTTVARLYHSEATVLQDGRVLISGSDPEDPRYPQEYRNEVFVPPYLLSGAARPSYKIATNQKDWTYGGSYTITNVVLPAGAGTKISLTGGVVSTHGNSMGQRMIFPAFTCSGTTCTIQAPPSVGIAPAGWYMLWLLDGPTPSSSTWVRIGGDPAGLGNWPNEPDFLKPGVGAIVGTTV